MELIIFLVTMSVLCIAVSMLTFMVVRSNRRFAEEIKKVQEKAAQALVAVYAEVERGELLSLVIENYGRAPALNLRIVFDDEFLNLLGENVRAKFMSLKHTYINLPPMQRVYCAICDLRSQSVVRQQVVNYDLSYDNVYSEKIELQGVIDLRGYAWAFVALDDVMDTIDKFKAISNNLKESRPPA